jgi:endo-1,4-beta-xylanase
MARLSLLGASLFGLVSACGGKISELPAYRLYPGRQLPASEVARLVGIADAPTSSAIITSVDGRKVADDDGPVFALLPGCHVVEINMGVTMANENIAWRGTGGSLFYALPMERGRTYVIRMAIAAMGTAGRVVVRAEEETATGETVARFDPARSVDEIKACLRATASAPSGLTTAESVGITRSLTPSEAAQSAATPAPRPPGSAAKTIAVPGLPSKITWTSTDPIILPGPDAKRIAVREPTAVRHNGKWHVFATSVSKDGILGVVYASFSDWVDAPKAALHSMDGIPGFETCSAPQVFYFEPKKTWFLVLQSRLPMYSTTDNIEDPRSWSQPMPFYGRIPEIVDNYGGWRSFRVICDAKLCHLFFANSPDRWFKAKTSIRDFPRHFDTPVAVVDRPETGPLLEAFNVYKLKGQDKYLALLLARDGTSGWRDYVRSWVADSLDGPWRAVHEDAAGPFAGEGNVFFVGQPWTRDIGRGDLVRGDSQQTMEIDGMNLRYLYQGYTADAPMWNSGAIPWKLGLLTAK